MKLLEGMIIFYLILHQILWNNESYAKNYEEYTKLPEIPQQEEQSEAESCVERFSPIYDARQSPIPVRDMCNLSIENNIDPALVTAISTVESGLRGYAWGCEYNISGIRRDCSEYDNYYDGINDLVNLLVRYRLGGRSSVEEIGEKYCPNTEENPTQSDVWIRKVNNLVLIYK